MLITSFCAIMAMAMPSIVSAAPIQGLQAAHAVIGYADPSTVPAHLKRGECEDKCNDDRAACIKHAVAVNAPPSFSLYCAEVQAKCMSRCQGMIIPERSVPVPKVTVAEVVLEKSAETVLDGAQQAGTKELADVKRGECEDKCNDDRAACIKHAVAVNAPLSFSLYCSEVQAKCMSRCQGMIIPE